MQGATTTLTAWMPLENRRPPSNRGDSHGLEYHNVSTGMRGWKRGPCCRVGGCCRIWVWNVFCQHWQVTRHAPQRVWSIDAVPMHTHQHPVNAQRLGQDSKMLAQSGLTYPTSTRRFLWQIWHLLAVGRLDSFLALSFAGDCAIHLTKSSARCILSSTIHSGGACNEMATPTPSWIISYCFCGRLL